MSEEELKESSSTRTTLGWLGNCFIGGVG